MIFAILATSLFTNFAKSSGDEVSASRPCLKSWSFTSGLESALVISPLSLAMMSFDTFDADIPVHGFDETLGNHQPDAGALYSRSILTQPIKRLKQLHELHCLGP